MNKYFFHIGDFNSATRHLTKEERWFYRDMLDLYYDKEEPLTGDLDLLCRRLCARTEQERTCVQQVLNEFFHLVNGRYHHHRCDAEIESYQQGAHKKSAAGKASAEARAKLKSLSGAGSSHALIENQHSSTGVEHLSTNQEPITHNKEPINTKRKVFSLEDFALAELMFEKLRALNPDYKKPSLEGWADEIRKIREIDNRNPEQIKAVFLWANNHDFWKTNILSPAKLRKQFDNLLVKMNNKPKVLLRVPENDSMLMVFAKNHKLQGAGTMTPFQYRAALRQEIATKKIYEESL